MFCHFCCCTSFHSKIRLSYPHVAITFSNFGWAQLTCHAGPVWALNCALDY
jgi:hypothetical protein